MTNPYTGWSSILLASVLFLVTGVLLFSALRLRHPLAIRKSGKTLSIALVILWFLAVLALLIIEATYLRVLRQQLHLKPAPISPIAPVTTVLAVLAILVILGLTKRGGVLVANVSAWVGVIVALAIFELPYDLIELPPNLIGTWHLSASIPIIPFDLLYFTPIIIVEIVSFALLSLSPFVCLSRYTLFLLAGMFLSFAIWACFGFAYPNTPIPFIFNSLGKAMAFAASVSLFLPQRTSAQGGAHQEQEGVAPHT